MALKSRIEALLRKYPPLFRFGSRVYHSLNSGFKSLSPGAPEAIKKAFELVKKLNEGEPVGDYYEFGLYKGYTFYTAYMAAKDMGLGQIRFYGFDSFQGLPSVEDVDKTGGRFFEGQFACTRRNVEKNLQKHGVDLSKVRLIEGFYDQTLNEELKNEIGAGRASVVLFDCDLYSSTRKALEWMEDLIADKTVMVFDDWYSFTEKRELGQQRALNEFKQRNRHFKFEPVLEYPRYGKMFVARLIKEKLR